MTSPDDRRYKSPRWRRIRLLVLARDGYRCYVLHCIAYANHCDHIKPVYGGMPDSEFYGMHNLRASCRHHNTARGVAARLERETAQGVAAPPRRTMFERPRSFNGASEHDRRLPKNISTSRTQVVTADYSRKPKKVVA